MNDKNILAGWMRCEAPNVQEPTVQRSSKAQIPILGNGALGSAVAGKLRRDVVARPTIAGCRGFRRSSQDLQCDFFREPAGRYERFIEGFLENHRSTCCGPGRPAVRYVRLCPLIFAYFRFSRKNIVCGRKWNGFAEPETESHQVKPSQTKSNLIEPNEFSSR
jgi:hypothetical protein